MPTALIADDEPVLLAELQALLVEAWPELDVIATATHGAEALRLLDRLRPDVAFLDIEMPRSDGMAVAATARDTRVVFVTAHERYAVQAFDRGAVDYLMKPVTPTRLALTVQRVKAELPDATPRELHFVQAWSGSTMRVVAIDDIVALLSEDKYTRVTTESGDLLLRRSLVDLRGALDLARFWTIGRGTVIHARYIDRVERVDGRELRVWMRSMSRPIVVGRTYRERFRGM